MQGPQGGPYYPRPPGQGPTNGPPAMNGQRPSQPGPPAGPPRAPPAAPAYGAPPMQPPPAAQMQQLNVGGAPPPGPRPPGVRPSGPGLPGTAPPGVRAPPGTQPPRVAPQGPTTSSFPGSNGHARPHMPAPRPAAPAAALPQPPAAALRPPAAMPLAQPPGPRPPLPYPETAALPAHVSGVGMAAAAAMHPPGILHHHQQQQPQQQPNGAAHTQQHATLRPGSVPTSPERPSTLHMSSPGPVKRPVGTLPAAGAPRQYGMPSVRPPPPGVGFQRPLSVSPAQGPPQGPPPPGANFVGPPSSLAPPSPRQPPHPHPQQQQQQHYQQPPPPQQQHYQQQQVLGGAVHPPPPGLRPLRVPQPGMQPPLAGPPPGPSPAAAMAPPSFGGPPSQQPPGSAPGAGMAPPAQQSMAGGGGGRNIDPSQMPRPPPGEPTLQTFDTRVDNTHHVPPPADAPIAVRDLGSAGPRHMRSSLNYVPQSADMLKSACLPLVVLVNPLAAPGPLDTPIQVVDATAAGPMRCSECKAYVNPHMRWTDGGRRMQCCFCTASTEVPPEYFSHLGADGLRRDKDDRPELNRGSVEFEVAGEYLVRPPMPPTYLFLIEVTAGAVSSGATACACASLEQLLEELPGGARARVAIVTFDSAVHFYCLRGGGAPPQMLVVSDVEEPYAPLAGDAAAVNVAENLTELRGLLEAIPRMFAGSQVGESAGGAALQAAVEALGGGTGGRVVALLSSLPHKGALALRPREAGRPPGEHDPLDVLTPEHKGYANLAVKAGERQVSVDIFALEQDYVDLGTLSALCTGTCGSTHRYCPFSPAADAARLHNDLRWALVRPQGMEAVGRMRVSSGLVVDQYVGAFHRRNTVDVNLPAVSCDHALAVRLLHSERLREGTEVYLQFALLYSTPEGARRVRLHTLALPVTRSLGTVFKGADLESFVAYMARKVSAQIPGRAVTACRDTIVRAAMDTLAAYRKQITASPAQGQLILPESLRLLPLYALALSKLTCFRTDARADARAVWMSRLLSLPVPRLSPLLYPHLWELHTLGERPQGGRATPLPDRLMASAAVLQPEGVYLLENGFDAFVYVGPAVAPDVCLALFGVPSPAPEALDAATSGGNLPELDTPLSVAARALVDEVRRQRCSFMHLRVLRRGHTQEAAFLATLVEDRSPSAGTSYMEFLMGLHRQIQNKLY